MNETSACAYEVKFANDLDINLHHVIYYHVKHSRPFHYFAAPMEFKQRWQRLMVIFVISGNISLNPGPVRYPCGSYAKPVRKIECELCNYWFHTKCIDMHIETYEKLSISTESWYCRTCTLSNFSDSFCRTRNRERLCPVNR